MVNSFSMFKCFRRTVSVIINKELNRKQLKYFFQHERLAQRRIYAKNCYLSILLGDEFNRILTYNEA